MILMAGGKLYLWQPNSTTIRHAGYMHAIKPDGDISPPGVISPLNGEFTMSNLITNYYGCRLAELGYNDMNVSYSLGYTQGSGMAFYGTLSFYSLSEILKRITQDTTGTYSAVERVKWLLFLKQIPLIEAITNSFVGEITGNSFSHQYSHYNTMNYDDSFYWEDILNDYPDDASIAEHYTGITRKMLEEWSSKWTELNQLISDDIVTTSQLLEKEGYALIEATPHERTVIMEKRTKDLVIRIYEEQDEEVYWLDDDDWESTAKAIVAGKSRYIDLVATICDIDTDDILYSESIGGLVIDVDDHRKIESYAGYRRELVKEVIAQYRKNSESLIKAAA